MHNLATACHAVGDSLRAIELLEFVIAKRSLSLGRTHALTLNALTDLVSISWDCARLEGSLPLFEETMKGARAVLGESDPRTIRAAIHLAGNYRYAGRLADAKKLLDEWLPRSRKLLGGEHEYTLIGLEVLAMLHAQSHRLADAEVIYQELLTVHTRTLPATHPRRASSLYLLGNCQLNRGKVVPAEKNLRECLWIREKDGADEWGTYYLQVRIGSCLLLQKKYAEAEPLLLSGYKGMHDRRDQMPAPLRSMRLQETLNALILLYDRWGKKDKANEWRGKLTAARAKKKP
jgi:tetratricopeptide (TPR) repeat protein